MRCLCKGCLYNLCYYFRWRSSLCEWFLLWRFVVFAETYGFLQPAWNLQRYYFGLSWQLQDVSSSWFPLKIIVSSKERFWKIFKQLHFLVLVTGVLLQRLSYIPPQIDKVLLGTNSLFCLGSRNENHYVWRNVLH